MTRCWRRSSGPPTSTSGCVTIATERDALRAQVNELSKQVGQLRRDGDTAAAEALQAESRPIGETEKQLADEHDDVSEALRQELLVIPNLPHPDAPDGQSDADNPVVNGPFLPESVRRPPARAALGDGHSARASSTTSAPPRSPSRCGRCSAAPVPRWRVRCASSRSTATPTPSRRSARRRWCRRRRSRRPVSSPSSPTTRSPSSATTCGASPPPRCR